MIAKFNGKCDLTGAAIVAGQTEIAKYGNATVLTEYATKEAVEAWFAGQVAEYGRIIAELRTITGREYANAEQKFSEIVANRLNSKFFVLKQTADNVCADVAQMQRNLDAKRTA